MHTPRKFLVKWEIDAEVDSFEEAAEYARNAQTAEDTEATVFDVTDTADGRTVRIDTLYGTSESVPQRECKGKAAARALAMLVTDPKIAGYLLAHDPKAYEQAQEALQPFGYPDERLMAHKLAK